MKNKTYYIFGIFIVSLSIILISNQYNFLFNKIRVELLGSSFNELKNIKFKIFNKSILSPVKVNISEKNYFLLQIERKKMMNNWILSQSLFTGTNKYYKAEVKSDLFDADYKYKARLFGSFHDHFKDPDNHSLRIKGTKKDGNEIQYNILKPWSRDYNINYLNNLIYKELSQGIFINYRPIHFFFNNLDYSVYLIEDFFSQNLLDSNNFNQGAFFTISENKIKYNYISNNLSILEDMSIPDYYKKIDNRKLSFFLTICLINNNFHPLGDENLHWFYNNSSGLIEPTYREGYIVSYDNKPVDINKMSNYNIFLHNYISDNPELEVEILKNCMLIKESLNKILSSERYLSFKKSLDSFNHSINSREDIYLNNLNFLINSLIIKVSG